MLGTADRAKCVMTSIVRLVNFGVKKQIKSGFKYSLSFFKQEVKFIFRKMWDRSSSSANTIYPKLLSLCDLVSITPEKQNLLTIKWDCILVAGSVATRAARKAISNDIVHVLFNRAALQMSPGNKLICLQLRSITQLNKIGTTVIKID